jgi:flagellar hook-associated protein 2
MVTYLEGASGPLTASKNSYTKLGENLQDQLDRLNTQQDAYQTNLNNTYTKLQTKLLSLKATQSYLQQQIDVWNK